MLCPGREINVRRGAHSTRNHRGTETLPAYTRTHTQSIAAGNIMFGERDKQSDGESTRPATHEGQKHFLDARAHTQSITAGNITSGERDKQFGGESTRPTTHERERRVLTERINPAGSPLGPQPTKGERIRLRQSVVAVCESGAAVWETRVKTGMFTTERQDKT